MDGSSIDHSDSDSGESWTLLENNPAYGEDAPDFSVNSSAPFERDHAEVLLEKDEDTDGISVISDSDPESGPCDISCDKCSSENSENRPPQSPQDFPHLLKNLQPPKKTIESICKEDDFLGDGSHKLKTYVHRRNKRLSMVLNIIMLGSVITAAGVAIGHMWGAKNECTVPTPSVNKILSNLYKLQEENAYLRNKLKEITLVSNIQQMQQSKSEVEKKHVKQHRCRKVFEEPLNNKVEKAFKCVDQDSEAIKVMDSTELLLHEKEFLNDIGKLKKVYNQNRSWLDEHIQRRLNNENKMRNKQNIKEEDIEFGKEQVQFKVYNHQNQEGSSLKSPNLEGHDESLILNNDFRIPESDKGSKPHKAWNLRKPKGVKNKVENIPKIKENDKSHKVKNLERQIKSEETDGKALKTSEKMKRHEAKTKELKISYADSLKASSDSQKVHSQINDSNELPIRGMRGYGHNRKHGDVDMLMNLLSSSEEEIKKDDRYAGPKMKREKKRHDRHKIHKKQKRKNKYEQWEMKGGYMKDFDEFSMTSSKVNLGNDITPDRKYLNHDFENYLAKLTEADQNKKVKKSDQSNQVKIGEKGKKGKNKDLEWYDKRYAMRAEARRKLEHELFGETSPNNAAWYFRRMNKREQCRSQKDNSTFKKFSKQKMNYKMKH